MTISYNYEIISVDENARCMEVIYRSTGYPDMHIGARLPYEGESLNSVIEQYSPVPIWLEITRAVSLPQVGTSGSIEPPQPTQNKVLSVTMRQARLALLQSGLLANVEAAITDPAAKIEWEYALTVDRNSPLVSSLSVGLGLTQQQLDDLFNLALSF